MLKFYLDELLKNRLIDIVSVLGLDYVDLDDVFCVKSSGSTASRVRARCWGLPRVWQQVLGLRPKYVIELLGDYFDKISPLEQDQLLIHELLHIPQTFSGALRNHRGSRGDLVSSRVVKDYYNSFIKKESLNMSRVKSYSSVNFLPALSINQRLSEIVNVLGFDHVDPKRVNCIFSVGTNGSLHARSWSFPRIWQQMLDLGPYYLIELIKDRFEELSTEYRDKLLIKELLFIPKTFSGALKNQKVSMRVVNQLYDRFISSEGLSWI